MNLNTPFNHTCREGQSVRLIAVPASRENPCEGCVAWAGGSLSRECVRLPYCNGVVFKDAAEAGPMTTAHPMTATNFGTASNIVAEPSPVGTSPSKLHAPSHGGYVGNGDQTTFAVARTDDPQTSKDAAKAASGGKLIDLILTAMQQPDGNAAGTGWTGKEMAGHINRPLNSVTPRFCQLERMGLIHVKGKRDRQNVYHHGNGVTA